MSAMVRPMLSDAVAAGDGAFSTWTMPLGLDDAEVVAPATPLGSTAWARTPAPPRTMSSSRRSGTSLLQRRHEGALRRTSGTSRRCRCASTCRAIRQKPRYVAISPASRRRDVAVAVALALEASTAFGPASTPPWIMRVKWTPRNGNARVGHGIDQVPHEAARAPARARSTRRGTARSAAPARRRRAGRRGRTGGRRS